MFLKCAQEVSILAKTFRDSGYSTLHKTIVLTPALLNSRELSHNSTYLDSAAL